MQQIVKLSVTEATNADVVVFADSDVTFVRPFGPSHVIKDGLVRLHRLPGMGNGPKHRLWNRKAADLLGIPPRDYFGYDYIGQLVTWKRQNLLGLHRRLEEIGKRGWQRILCGTLHFAEYILYGVFVDQVLGESSGHYHDEADLCHCSWHRTITTEPELTRFFNEIQEQHVAVLVQSYLPFGLDRVRELTERASGGR